MGFPFEKEIQVLKNNKKRGGGGCWGRKKKKIAHLKWWSDKAPITSILIRDFGLW